MFKKILDIRRVIKRKNEQLRGEREKLLAAEAANRILSNYLLCFVKKAGEVRVTKAEMTEIFGNYRADVSANDDEYVIKVRGLTSSEKKMFKEPEIAWRRRGKGNGACAKDKPGDHGDKGQVNSRTEGGEGFEKD